MATVTDRGHGAADPRSEKPEWAMSRRERDNLRRAREGLPPRRRRWPWVVLALILLGAGGGWYYQTQILPTLPRPEIVAPPAAPEIDSRMQVNPFEYAPVAPQTLRRVVRVTGTLQPSQQAQISAQTAGRVEVVTVRPGDSVAAGDVLVQLDVARLRLELDQQRSNAEATRSQLSLAQAQFERVQALVDRGVATTSDLDQARTNLEGLQASLSALTDQVAAAELSLSQATVTAPFAGVVSARSVEPGQFVSVGTPLLSIVDLGTVEIEAHAPVSAGSLIAAGQAVLTSVDGLPDRRFTGTVVRINPVATEGARTLPVYVMLDNADGLLVGGMFATGEIVVAEAEGALAVPAEALREDREGLHVLRIEDGVVVSQPVTTAETWAGELVQVTEGLSPGDMVITAALPELSPGDAVILVE